MLVKDCREIKIKCNVAALHKRCKNFARMNGLMHEIRGIKYKDAVSWFRHSDNADNYICITGYTPKKKKRISVFGDSPYMSELENFIKQIKK